MRLCNGNDWIVEVTTNSMLYCSVFQRTALAFGEMIHISLVGSTPVATRSIHAS